MENSEKLSCQNRPENFREKKSENGGMDSRALLISM